MANRPKILFLTPCWPLGRTFGGQLRALYTARALQQLGDVSLMVVGSEAGDTASATLSAAEFQIVPSAPATIRPNKGAWQRFRWAVDLHYLNVHGCAVTSHDRERVVSYFEAYDLIWILNSRTANLLQVWRWPHAHLDIDDIPSAYALNLGRTEHTLVKRWKARTQRILLHRRERRFTDRFTTLSVCSEADRTYLGERRAHVIPNGFARPRTVPLRLPSITTPRIGFIGLYSYPPNMDGVRWFLQQSWPAIQRAVPGVRFRLIGRDCDGALKPPGPAVDALGWLDEPSAEIATWSAMVVPIRLGGGTRIKLADAFSRKCPVVATSLGAYGYAVKTGQHLLVADDPSSFTHACLDLLQRPELGRKMAEAAWDAFQQNWTWEAIAPKILAAANDCLEGGLDSAAVA